MLCSHRRKEEGGPMCGQHGQEGVCVCVGALVAWIKHQLASELIVFSMSTLSMYVCALLLFIPGFNRGGKNPRLSTHAVMHPFELAGSFLHYWIPVALCIWDGSPGEGVLFLFLSPAFASAVSCRINEIYNMLMIWSVSPIWYLNLISLFAFYFFIL